MAVGAERGIREVETCGLKTQGGWRCHLGWGDCLLCLMVNDFVFSSFTLSFLLPSHIITVPEVTEPQKEENSCGCGGSAAGASNPA